MEILSALKAHKWICIYLFIYFFNGAIVKEWPLFSATAERRSVALITALRHKSALRQSGPAKTSPQWLLVSVAPDRLRLWWSSESGHFIFKDPNLQVVQYVLSRVRIWGKRQEGTRCISKLTAQWLNVCLCSERRAGFIPPSFGVDDESHLLKFATD